MKNIVDYLQQLNFTRYESTAYLTLLKHSPVTGYELAKKSGIPASKIYQVLNKLIEKEVVLALDSDPVTYIPSPPDDVIARLRGSYLSALDSLSENLQSIYRRQDNGDQYIWNFSGREEIMRRLNEFIDQATRSVYLSVWDEEIFDIRESLLNAEQRGVKMAIVHYGKSRLKIGREYWHGREHQIRQERGARRISLEVDEEKVLLAHFLENGETNALWTSNKGVVLLAKDYIIHDIYTIRMAEKFGREAIEIFESH